MNCIAINTPSGQIAVRTQGRCFTINCNFYDNAGTDFDNAGVTINPKYLDPQFKDPDNLDYTRTGDNLNRLGFSDVGMVSGVDYDISIGPDGIVEDLPAITDVRSGTDYDFARLTGSMVTQPEPPRYVVRMRNNRRTIAIRED